MFDNLDERIKHDDYAETTPRERIAKAILIAVLSVLLFGSLYFAVRMSQ
jgi:hypothetical protein